VWVIAAALSASFGCESRQAKQDRAAEAAFQRGAQLQRKRKIPEAIAAFREAIRLKPDHVDAHAVLGSDLLFQGMPTEATAEIREAIRLKPPKRSTMARLHSELGDALVAQKMMDEAVAPYREAIELEPEYKYAHYGLGIALFRVGQSLEAIAEFREALRIDPNYAQAHFYIGDVLTKLGQDAEAMSEFRHALKIRPEVTPAHRNLAFVIALDPGRSREEYDEALYHVHRGIQLNAIDASCYMTLSLVEYRLGHQAESLAAGDRCLKLAEDDNGIYWFVLAIVHAKAGHTAKALKWFDDAVKVSLAFPDVPNESDTRRLWTEAAEVLGQPGPPPIENTP
jgi:tetratricopeptide (TPR) repeat protein